MSADAAILAAAVKRREEGARITHLQARVIANAWHGGQGTALYAFASSGAIISDANYPEYTPLLDEISAEQAVQDGTHWRELDALRAYVAHHGPRGAQPGWSELSW